MTTRIMFLSIQSVARTRPGTLLPRRPRLSVSRTRLHSSKPTKPLQPSDPNYSSRIHDSFAKQNVMALLGASLSRVEPGFVEIELPFHEKVTQQHGFVHGGVIACILDSACGYAASTLMPADAGVLSIEFKTSFLAPASGSLFRFRGRVKKAGKTVTFTEGEALAFEKGEERTVGTMSGTMMTIRGREGVKG